MNLNGDAPRRNASSTRALKGILDAATDGYGRWRIPSGDLNFGAKWLKSLGYSRSNLKSEGVKGLIHPEDAAAFESQVQALIVGDVKALAIEIRFQTKSGDYRWFEIRGRATRNDRHGTPMEVAATVCGVTYDITDRKRTTNALEENEERLRLAIASGRMYAFEWEPATDLIKRSKESEAILGLSADKIHRTKQEIVEMVFEEDRDIYVRTIRSLSPKAPTYKMVFRLCRGDGNMLWLEESGRAFFNSDGAISKVVGMTNDVTEMRESERALRELSGRLISSQEEERQRIARELHDHIGQEMALLCVQAHRLSSSLSELESARGEAHRIYKKAKEIATEISKLSHRLHSTELDFLGLAMAAERLCRDFSNQSGLTMDFASAKMPSKLDISKTRCFYRILQEALQNISKHSHASGVRVRLDASNQLLTMEIQDNGIGFDLQKARVKAGLGLVSIRERLHLVGGRFTLTSKTGQGTTLAASVPI